MTIQRQHITVVIAARIGQPPIYPKIGQGLLGGTIEQVFIGDAVEAHAKLSELNHAFSVEFDRGELTVPALRLALWQAHWWRSLRPVAERAADILHLGAVSGIAAGGLAAQRCAEIEAALTAMTQERPPANPIGDALLRGEPIPENDGLSRLDLNPSALSFGTCRPLCEADPQALAQHHQATQKLQHPGSSEQVPERDFSGPVFDFTRDKPQPVDPLAAHSQEMHEMLKRIGETVGVREDVLISGDTPSDQLDVEASRALEEVQVLLDKIAGFPPLTAEPLQADSPHSSELERIKRGLMALAEYIGEIPMTRVQSAMGRRA